MLLLKLIWDGGSGATQRLWRAGTIRVRRTANNVQCAGTVIASMAALPLSVLQGNSES